MLVKLVDAAETLLQDQGVQGLTAGAVAGAAGIARNSLYRYVDSVSQLQVLVINKYLPQWNAAVLQAMAAQTSPQDKIRAYVRTNLEWSAPGGPGRPHGHGWLMKLAGGLNEEARDQLADVHTELFGSLARAVAELDLPLTGARMQLIQHIITAGFTSLDACNDTDAVIELSLRCVEPLLV